MNAPRNPQKYTGLGAPPDSSHKHDRLAQIIQLPKDLTVCAPSDSQ